MPRHTSLLTTAITTVQPLKNSTSLLQREPAGTARPKVSICIPTYNQGRYVALAIESALSQEFDSLEVVVSDNHSTDETAEVLAAIGDPRLRVVRPERHLDMAEHFDFCIRESEGDYVNVLCSDDRLLPGYAGRLAAVLDQHPTAALAYSAAYIIDEKNGTSHIERHSCGSFFRKGEDDVKRFLQN